MASSSPWPGRRWCAPTPASRTTLCWACSPSRSTRAVSGAAPSGTPTAPTRSAPPTSGRSGWPWPTPRAWWPTGHSVRTCWSTTPPARSVGASTPIRCSLGSATRGATPWRAARSWSVEASDLARALRYRPMVSASRYRALWQEALVEADDLLAGLLASVDPARDVVLVLAPYNLTGDRDLTAVGLRGPGIDAGYLRSASTQRAGFLTLVDVAPTILATSPSSVRSTWRAARLKPSRRRPPSTSGWTTSSPSTRRRGSGSACSCPPRWWRSSASPCSRRRP